MADINTNRPLGEEAAKDTSMKGFACKDTDMACEWQTTGRSEDEVLENVRQHAETEHKDIKFTDQLKNKVRSLIRPVREKAA